MTGPVTFMRAIQLGADLQLVVSAVEEAGGPAVSLRLHRRSPSDFSRDAFHPTAAGLHCPTHLTPRLIELIEQAAARAIEHRIVGP